MIIQLDVTKVTLQRIENYLLDRMREIDGHPERMTVADEVLTQVLVEGRKAMKADKRKGHKNGFANIAKA